ncbi:MAG: 4Fe-4S binding protein [Anaerolineae bacterium]|nr:4Fe-4S binding protein [Anaerolineae bacterium]
MSVGTARNGLGLRIDEGLCLVCDDCLARRQCRGSAIRIIDRGEAPFLDLSRCWGCMTCMSACPAGAIVRQDRCP